MVTRLLEWVLVKAVGIANAFATAYLAAECAHRGCTPVITKFGPQCVRCGTDLPISTICTDVTA